MFSKTEAISKLYQEILFNVQLTDLPQTLFYHLFGRGHGCIDWQFCFVLRNEPAHFCCNFFLCRHFWAQRVFPKSGLKDDSDSDSDSVVKYSLVKLNSHSESHFVYYYLLDVAVVYLSVFYGCIKNFIRDNHFKDIGGVNFYFVYLANKK